MVDLHRPPEPIGDRPLKDRPRAELEFMSYTAGHRNAISEQRQEGADPKAELYFRDRDWKVQDFALQEHARTQAQDFQRKLVDDQIEAAEAVSDKQLKVATLSAVAAAAAAFAAIGLLIVSAIRP